MKFILMKLRQAHQLYSANEHISLHLLLILKFFLFRKKKRKEKISKFWYFLDIYTINCEDWWLDLNLEFIFKLKM